MANYVCLCSIRSTTRRIVVVPGVAFVLWLLTTSSMIGGTHGWISFPAPASTKTTTRRACSSYKRPSFCRTGAASFSCSTSHLKMVSDLFGGMGKSSSGDQQEKKKLQQQLPRDVKQAVTNCRNAVQEALQKRVSRMDVEFPVGTKFGVEKGGGGKAKKKSNDGSNTPTLQDLVTSDRELARLFVDMFQPVGSDRITVVFTDQSVADIAKQKWKDDATAQCRILAMNRRKSSGGGKKKTTKARGFAAKLAAEIDDGDSAGITFGPFQLPEDTEVALFVAPGPLELVVIERICDAVGMSTLIVLLNARLSLIDNFGSAKAATLFNNDFESVFYLSAAPQKEAPGCLLYREYPGDWVLARKPAVGQPKTILTVEHRPSPDECRDAFGLVEISEMEKGIENAIENVANFLR